MMSSIKIVWRNCIFSHNSNFKRALFVYAVGSHEYAHGLKKIITFISTSS